jgi:hypothetical protein
MYRLISVFNAIVIYVVRLVLECAQSAWLLLYLFHVAVGLLLLQRSV